MGHVLVRLVIEGSADATSSAGVSSAGARGVSRSIPSAGLGLPQPQAAQVLQVVQEDRALVVQQVLLQQELCSRCEKIETRRCFRHRWHLGGAGGASGIGGISGGAGGASGIGGISGGAGGASALGASLAFQVAPVVLQA